MSQSAMFNFTLNPTNNVPVLSFNILTLVTTFKVIPKGLPALLQLPPDTEIKEKSRKRNKEKGRKKKRHINTNEQNQKNHKLAKGTVH